MTTGVACQSRSSNGGADVQFVTREAVGPNAARRKITIRIAHTLH